ncbi:hypothetical protein [Celeribacter neptunius]|uniref:SH3 domain-containing protein n=1 Tax=Celeribacter neptunius TaxID=588602 RepID=A0A1I3QS09_9RHOB|nr:hypothetical protein [Celeribacter neptunius]SFJ36031.1 hypothetical protein SAMN04487991_1918 [Celeribacter neptunius]
MFSKTRKSTGRNGLGLGLVVVAVLSATPAIPYSGEYFVTCRLDPNGDNFLALRECTGSGCDRIMKLPPDTFLLSMEPDTGSGWRDVIVLKGLQDESYSGPRGWVYDKYICPVIYK